MMAPIQSFPGPVSKSDTWGFTFISLLFIGDFLQVNEMGCQCYIVHAAFIPHLDFHSPTQGRKHFLEDHLFMPHGIGTILLHCGSPLKTKPGGWEPWRGKNITYPRKHIKPAGNMEWVLKNNEPLPPSTHENQLHPANITDVLLSAWHCAKHWGKGE